MSVRVGEVVAPGLRFGRLRSGGGIRPSRRIGIRVPYFVRRSSRSSLRLWPQCSQLAHSLCSGLRSPRARMTIVLGLFSIDARLAAPAPRRQAEAMAPLLIPISGVERVFLRYLASRIDSEVGRFFRGEQGLAETLASIRRLAALVVSLVVV